MAKRKQSKAETEYNRIRKNLLQQRRRHESKGTQYYFDLPPTPKQELWGTGRGATAKDYREATAQLKNLKSMFDEAVKQSQVEIPDASDIIIENFLQDLKFGAGGQIITDQTKRLQSKYGSSAVANAINEMANDGILITKAEFYNPDYAFRYIGEMGQYLQGRDTVTEEQWKQFEDELYSQYGEMVPEELQ